MIIMALAIAVTLFLLVRVALLVLQQARRSATASHYSNNDEPLEFPQGCLNCRKPVTLPWIYKEAPESFCCSHCQTNFRISFIPGGVQCPPIYEWVELNPCSGVAMGAVVGDCPDCHSQRTFYIEQRHNSARHPTARCRACGFAERL